MIDVRTVQPLDSQTDPGFRPPDGTGPLVVHEAVTFGGIGAEIAAQIQEEAFDYLDVHRSFAWEHRSRRCRSARCSSAPTFRTAAGSRPGFVRLLERSGG